MSSYELNSTAKANEALAAIGGTGFGSNSIQLLKQLVVAAGVYRSNQFVGPLDEFTAGLAGTWSVARRLLTSYEGALIRVRRSNDNAEQDIGYTSNGSLDTVALLAFCGAGDGFVKTLYDQEGGNNYAQPTAANQPAIVLAGVLQTDDGTTPAIRCEQGPSLVASSFSGSAASLYYRARNLQIPPGINGRGAIVSGIGNDPEDVFPWADGILYYGAASSTRKTCGVAPTAMENAYLVTCVSETDNWVLRINGAENFSTVTNTVQFGTLHQIGRTPTFPADGWFTEMAFYNVAHTSTQWAEIEPIFQP